MRTSAGLRTLLTWIALASLAAVLPGADEAPIPAVQVGVDHQPATLTLLSWNVLNEPTAREARLPALFKLLADSHADVIALQEVTPWFLDLLLAQGWTRDYRKSTFAGQVTAPGGLLLLSRFPLDNCRIIVIPSRLDRCAVRADLRLGGRRLALATVHLESPLADGAIRARQLAAVFGELAGNADSVLLGDCNFGDGEQPDSAALDPLYVDLWTRLHPGEAGFTWNIEKSPMAKAGSFPAEPSRRLDRILLRSAVWRPAAMRIIGDAPVASDQPGVFPSDHFGVLGVIAR